LPGCRREICKPATRLRVIHRSHFILDACMAFAAPFSPLLSPGLVLSVDRKLASLPAAPRQVTVQLPLQGIANAPAAPSRAPQPAADSGPRLLRPGHVSNLRAQWEARTAPAPAQEAAPRCQAQQTYRQPPLPPAATFMLTPAFEGAPAITVNTELPSLALLATMDEHRREHADAFQWNPLLQAGRPYAPRARELHPHGIQARMLGGPMGAGEPPVITHTPERFAQRVAVEQLRQVLAAYIQIKRDAGVADPHGGT
jgi:hypothetical protein